MPTAEWVELLKSGMLAAAIGMILRSVLIAVIVVWSFKTNEAGRRHALALLRLLRAPRSKTGRGR